VVRLALRARELSFDFNAMPLEELSQVFFDHPALSMHAAFGLYGINLRALATGSGVNVVLGIKS
jgi:hypothetical protein